MPIKDYEDRQEARRERYENRAVPHFPMVVTALETELARQFGQETWKMRYASIPEKKRLFDSTTWAAFIAFRAAIGEPVEESPDECCHTHQGRASATA